MFTESILVMGNRGPYNRVAARVQILPGGGVALMRRLRVHEPIAALEEHNGADWNLRLCWAFTAFRPLVAMRI